MNIWLPCNLVRNTQGWPALLPWKSVNSDLGAWALSIKIWYMTTLILRQACRADAPAIAALIGELMPYMLLTPDGAGAGRFIDSLSVAAIERYVVEPDYRYMVGLTGSTLAGVVALRDNMHLFHLFVAPSLHGQGIGRQLWIAARDAALAAGNTAGFTVNSSPYAVPVYERFGFAASAPRIEQHGIAYIPMRLLP